MELDHDTPDCMPKLEPTLRKEALQMLEKLDQFLKENPTEISDKQQGINRQLRAQLHVEELKTISQLCLDTFLITN